MFPQVARASLLDSLRFNSFHVIPMALQGVFKKRPFWVRLIGRLHPDPLGKWFIKRMRSKFHTPYVDLLMLTKRTRLLLDPEGIRHVLEHSPEAYADPKSKHGGMTVFQPNAVTISRMPPWAMRRWFNDAVLSAGVSAPLDTHFVKVVREEGARWHARSPSRLTWADLQDLFDRITLRVVFGDTAADDRPLLDALDKLMARANRVLFRRRSKFAFETLNGGIRRYLEAADPKSLVGTASLLLRSPDLWPEGTIPPPEVLRPENQVPHWLFAMKDTLAANTAFAIALIAAHPDIECRARAEFPGDRSFNAADVHGAKYLESCVQEAMRMWPTTPMLLREATCAGVLGDVHGPGLQVLIWNGANHRDSAVVPAPDRFHPDRWNASGVNWQFNHLSNGRQECAGKALALFLLKAVITELFARSRFVVGHPRLPAGGPMPERFNWFQFDANATRP